MTTDDMRLVGEYARHHSEEAFATLVSRHVNLVYSVALHQLRDASLAEEVAQATFIILARKAGSLSPKTVLSAWLCRTAQYVAANAVRTEYRRKCREQETYMQSVMNQPEPESSPWPDIAPLLNIAMGELGDKYHCAIVLRFFEGKDFKQIGAELRVDERTAQTRVRRAVENMRRFFIKRGITLSAAVIMGAIATNSVQAAPAALANTVTAVALGNAATASGSTLTLIKGALKIMAWTKAKTAIVAGVVVLLAAGTTPVIIKEIQEHRTYPWQVAGFTVQRLNQAPSQVAILRSRIRSGSSMGNTTAGKIMGTGVTAQSVVGAAYGVWRPTRTVPFKGLPDGRFDFIASLPGGNREALQQEVKRKFGVVAKRETRETDVLLLKIQRSDASGLIRGTAGRVSVNENNNRLSFTGCTIDSLAANLEPILKIPVLNQTGLAGNFDIDLKWDDRNPEGLKQTVLDTLGLELVPSREPIEMLVMEKVN